MAVSTSPVPRSTTPVPSSTIKLLLRSIESGPRLSWMETSARQNTKFDPSGLFVFPRIADGRYTLEVANLPPNAYISDIRVGDKSAYDNGFVASEVKDEITVTVESNGGRIHGSVHDSDGHAFDAARVVLAPSLSRRQNRALYKSVFSDRTGNFTLTGIAPGNYKMFAWDVVMEGGWTNAEFMTEYESLGQTVIVRESGDTEIDLKVISAKPEHR